MQSKVGCDNFINQSVACHIWESQDKISIPVGLFDVATDQDPCIRACMQYATVTVPGILL